jgi:hypothetical protein
MNKNKSTLQLVLTIFIVLLLVSIVSSVYSIQWKPLRDINIISDIFTSKSSSEKNKQKQDSSFYVIKLPQHAGGDSLSRSFYHFFRKDRITSFYDDTNTVAMNGFMRKLYELKKRKGKIRIAFLGDSMAEGDFISSTLRKLLQQEFGGSGGGFVPIETVADAATVTIRHSGNWRDENFRTKHRLNPVFLSGHAFYAASDASFSAKDNTVAATQTLSKRLFTGRGVSCNVAYNGVNKTIYPNNLFNNILLDTTVGNTINLAVNNDSLPIYGVSFESDEGIILDNFSFRGSGGIEFAKFDTSFLKAIAENNSYDLIIMQYGINLIENSTDTNFNWYYKPMKASVNNLHRCFPQADILIVSTADRAFRYDNEMQTAVGIKDIIALQEKIAYETNSSFYNMFSSMGGDGSMVKWVEEKPTLAYQDYMHPNSVGSEILGRSMFDAIMHEYKKIK